MQIAARPTSVAVKPAIRGGVSPLMRTVAFGLLPLVVPMACGSWQVGQVCGWDSSSSQSTVMLAVGSPGSSPSRIGSHLRIV